MFVKPLNRFVENEGNLYPLELKTLPFKPKRIFFVTNVPKGEIRGLHAHYNTQQILICIKGIIRVGICNNDGDHEVILNEGESVFIDKMTWDWQQYETGDDVLISICSTKYDPKDYINNKEEFLKILSKVDKNNG